MSMSYKLLYSPWVLFVISTLFWWFILTPIAIYYLNDYYQHRNNVSIKHRHWEIVLVFGIFCIFFWSIERPLEFIWKLQGNDSKILESIHYILFPVTIHGFIWLIVWRYYMIYYNIKFYEENINMKWKIIINNTNYNINAKNKQFNWFLVHKKKYGSLKWLTPRICTIFLILISILISIQFCSQLIANLLDGIISFYSIPILLILWHRTPSIQDHFHIGIELTYIIILCLIEWSIYFLGSFVNFIIFDENHKNHQIIFIFIQSWTGVLFAFCIVIICTKWTLSKCNIDKTQKSQSTPSSSASSASSLSMATNPSNSTSIITTKQPNFHRKVSPISPRGRQLKLYECLQCNEGFNCFMNHLMSEFNHECLLSVIEFVQFKQGLSYSYTYILGTEIDHLPFIGNHAPSNNYRESNYSNTLTLETSKSITFNSQNSMNSPHIFSPNSLTKLAHIKQGSEISCNFDDLNDKLSHSSSCDDKDDKDDKDDIIITTTSILSAARSDSSHGSNNNKREILTSQFPSCVPKSFIVFKKNYKKHIKNTNKLETNQTNQKIKERTKHDVLNEYKGKAYDLFSKYIYNAHQICEYEININYNMRKKLILLMGNKEKWLNNVINEFDELYILFDECILEMYDLMCHSFQRFKKTKQFAKLDRKIFCKASFPETFLN